MLLSRVEEILEDHGYGFCEYSGCFDLAARRDKILLLKVLTNIDSFQESQANNLKVLSHNLDAKSLLIGLHTRREQLMDNIIYDRFSVPTVNPKTLENLLDGVMPSLYRFRGGLFVEISPKALRQAREENGLSQSELAKSVGVSKKNVYEHESGKEKIVYENAKRMEKVLHTKLIVPLELKLPRAPETEPKTSFESKISHDFKRIGFSTDSVYQSPFNMIAKDSESLVLSEVDSNQKHIKKNLPHIKEFSKVTKKTAIIVTKEEINCDIPSLREKDLKELNSKDLKKFIRKW